MVKQSLDNNLDFIEIHHGYGYVSVYDKDYESAISFENILEDFKKAIKESPEYFTDEMVVTLYHYIQEEELVRAGEIIFDMEADIVGHSPTVSVEHLLVFAGDYSWLDLSVDEKMRVVANGIKKRLGE